MVREAVTEEERIQFVNPLVIMHELDDHSIACAIHRSEHVNSHEAYGLLVCDLVRHVATAFQVPEDAVWEWVDKERYHHTTEIGKPQ
jgi:hypothetical protein